MVISDCQTRGNRNRCKQLYCSNHKQDKSLIDINQSSKRYVCKNIIWVVKVIEARISDWQMPGKLVSFTRLWMFFEPDEHELRYVAEYSSSFSLCF